MQVVHYTTLANVEAILANGGFWFVPNDRAVMDRLLPGVDLGDHEPQRFGTVSFTALPPEEAQLHREHFGPFGIGVTPEWARSHEIQPVIYLDEGGPVVRTLRLLFQTGHRELQIRKAEEQGVPPAVAQLGQSVHNKRVAALFDQAELWAEMLTLFEFMEPADHEWQREWRIVQSDPFHFNTDTRAGHFEEAARDASGWRGRQLEFELADLVCLVAPADRRNELVNILPDAATDLPVQTY